MSMADILRIFLLIVGSLMVFISYWLVSQALVPKFVERCTLRYTEHPFRTTFVGLAIMGPLFFIAIAILGNSGHPAGKVLSVVLMAVPVLLGLAGSTGLSRRIGLGLPSAIDAHQPWRCVLRGGIVLCLTFLLPFAGWFFVLPWTVISGLGAAAGSLGGNARLAGRTSQEANLPEAVG